MGSLAYVWRGRECCVNDISLSTGIFRPRLSDLGKLVENAGFWALPHNWLLTILDPRWIIYNHSSWATLMYLRATVSFFRQAAVLSVCVWTKKPKESGAPVPVIQPWTCYMAPLHLTSYEFIPPKSTDGLPSTWLEKNQKMGRIRTTMQAQWWLVTWGVFVSAE